MYTNYGFSDAHIFRYFNGVWHQSGDNHYGLAFDFNNKVVTVAPSLRKSESFNRNRNPTTTNDQSRTDMWVSFDSF